MKESQIQSLILGYLNTLENSKAFKIPANLNKGISDIVCCYKGQYLAIEVKKTSTRLNLSPLQFKHKYEIEKALGKHLIATSVQDVKEFIKELGDE